MSRFNNGERVARKGNAGNIHIKNNKNKLIKLLQNNLHKGRIADTRYPRRRKERKTSDTETISNICLFV